MRVRTETITPERAKEMLATMKDNRKIRPTHVAQLARDMENGNFLENNDAICFNENGELVNGQHRLAAVVKSGVTIDMLVAYNFSNVGIIDRPAVRSTADTLRMRGIVGNMLSGNECVALVNAYISAKYTDHNIWTDTDKEDFIIENLDVLPTALEISHKGSHHPVLRKAGPAAAIFAALKAGIAEDKLFHFAECTNTGFYNGDSESASSVLRTQLLSGYAARGGHMSQKEQISWTEQAIRDFAIGRPRRNSYIKLDRFIYV